MKGTAAFLRKELMEQMRTWRAPVLLLIFLLFGIMSPALAKLMPEVLAMMPMDGIVIELPPVQVGDAHVQLHKNITQMGMVALVLVFAGSLSQEITRGTLLMPLSKGLRRSGVVVAKGLSALLVWTLCLVLAAGAHCGYTVWLFGELGAPGLWPALLCLWLFGAFLIALMLFAGACMPGAYGGLILTVAVMALLLILGIIPPVAEALPTALAGQAGAMLTGGVSLAEVLPSLVTTVLSTIALTVLSAFVLSKRTL